MRALPIYSRVMSKYGRWLWKNESGKCDVIFRGKSIYHQIHTLFWWLGFGIAWGFRHNSAGQKHMITEHKMAWDRCMRGEAASQVWIGRMEVTDGK